MTDMTKRLFTFALFAGFFSLAACSSEPSDLRPGNKLSVDVVPPGTRSSPNLDNAADNSPHDTQQQVQLNHDAHTNNPADTSKGPETTVVGDSVENHN
jgi:hypothetical protein